MYACYVVSVFTEEEDSCKYLSTDPLAKVLVRFISLRCLSVRTELPSDFFPSLPLCVMALTTLQGSAIFTVRIFLPSVTVLDAVILLHLEHKKSLVLASQLD